MKKIFLPIVLILFSTLLISIMPTEAEAAIYEDTVKLHILANSDSDEDQQLKLDIRDEILTHFATELKASKSTDEAKETLGTLLPDIEGFAEEEIRKRGYDYSVTATLSEEWYDTREYDGFTLPRGVYTSLQIKIGKAEGKNWWCVMFPPLCLDMASENAPADDVNIDYTKEEMTLITTKKYNVKFKTLELLAGIFE